MTAPIAGRIGTSSVTAGALVTAGQDAALATIQRLDPVYLDVTQSSTQMLALRRQLDAGLVKAIDGKAQVKVLLEDGSTYAHEGTLEFVGSAVDPGTGNVVLRAVIPNPEGLLLPGMYLKAVLPMATDARALLVPQKAVLRNERGEPLLRLLDAKDRVVERRVSTGQVVGNQWQITQGLKAGERVIVSNGSAVARPAGAGGGGQHRAAGRNAGDRPDRQHRRNVALRPAAHGSFLHRPADLRLGDRHRGQPARPARDPDPAGGPLPADRPTITIRATYTGASSQTVENAVTQVIEQSQQSLDHLMYMTSTSASDGSAQVNLVFATGTNPDTAQVQVQNQLQAAMATLPQAVQQNGLTITKSSGSIFEVLSFTSEDGSMDNSMSPTSWKRASTTRSAASGGVGNIQPIGQEYAMRIWLDPEDAPVRTDAIGHRDRTAGAEHRRFGR